MHLSPYGPLSFGPLLDRSFRLYRTYFLKFSLLTLMFFGPLYLCYSVLLSKTFGDAVIRDSLFSYDSSPAASSPIEGTGWIVLVICLAIISLLLPVVIPVVFSTVTGMVEAVYNRQEPSIRSALAVTMRRFWPLFGNSLLFSLALTAVYMIFTFALMIIFIIVGFFIAGVFGLASSALLQAGPLLIFAGIVLYIVFILFMYSLIGFFAIRWGFFIPAVVMEHEGIGLSRSWKLTKGSFWRIFLAFAVVGVASSAIFSVNLLLVQVAVPLLFLKVLISVLLMVVAIPLPLILYAVSYFDMRSRREGTDLARMLEELRGPAAGRVQAEMKEAGFDPAHPEAKGPAVYE